MQHKEDQFSVDDDLVLFCQSWQPEDAVQAVVIVVHGFGDHSSRFDNIVQFMAPRGIAVYCFDQRGHGRSPGQRGHIDDFGQFRTDLQAFRRYVEAQQPQQPLFLLGQSMGGLIVLNYALTYPQGLQGVLALSPHLSDPPVSPVLVKLSHLISRVWPTFSLDIGLKTSRLSRDAGVVKAYENDPLVHGKASTRLGAELSAAVAWTQANAHSFQPPLFMTHGDADVITNPEGSRRFFEAVESPAKEMIIYQGGYHELHNDIHRERALMDMTHWIESRVKAATQQSQQTD